MSSADHAERRDLPLAGVRVVELAHFVFVPSVGAMLGGLGAEVVKVEHPSAPDPYRALTTAGLANDSFAIATRTTQTNRSKKSIGVNLKTNAGRELIYRLVERADVFLTSFRTEALERLGVSQERLAGINPGLIYARGDAYGPLGAESELPGYDMTAFWARGGVADLLSHPDDVEAVRQPGAFGDRIGALGLFAGVLTALFGRERGVPAATVNSSLLHAAAWITTSPLVSAVTSAGVPPVVQTAPPTPLTASYRCLDGRWIMLCLLQSDKYWEELCRTLGAGELAVDPRFVDATARGRHGDELRGALRRIFAQHTLGEWCGRLAGFSGPWSPVQNAVELAADPQVAVNGVIDHVNVDGIGRVPVVTAPFVLGSGPERLTLAPEPGEDTEAVLLELGIDWPEIVALKELDAII